jgi:hypothetical protein
MNVMPSSTDGLQALFDISLLYVIKLALKHCSQEQKTRKTSGHNKCKTILTVHQTAQQNMYNVTALHF